MGQKIRRLTHETGPLWSALNKTQARENNVERVVEQGEGKRQPEMIGASVVVCTHNRAELLPPLVAVLRTQAFSGAFEVIVVDSGSTDGTQRVLEGLVAVDAPPVRTLRMERPGLSAARNRGLEAAAGNIVAFLDDDALPRPGWLAELVGSFAEPNVGSVGGRVLLRFEGNVPAWLTESLFGYLSAYDLGPTPRQVGYTPPMEQYPRGANIAVRRTAAAALGGFRSIFGRKGRSLRSNEEADLCYRLEAAGWRLRYVPGAAVDHIVWSERLHPRWFLKRFAAQGRSDALFYLSNCGIRRALGRLRWYHGAHLLLFPYRPGAAPDPARLLAECERREAWGYVGGLALGMPLLIRGAGGHVNRCVTQVRHTDR